MVGQGGETIVFTDMHHGEERVRLFVHEDAVFAYAGFAQEI